MSELIRQLTPKDLSYYKKMQTGLADDYMLQVFDLITDGDHYLYGLFVQDDLVALSGFTVFKKYYAMLGRLRTDQRYRKNGFGTKIVDYSLHQAMAHPDVHWIGANTEQYNTAAQSVLKKVGLPPVQLLYAAQTTSVKQLIATDSIVWNELLDEHKKMEWIKRTYLHPTFDKKVFPLEAYYPFPISQEMFTDSLQHWHFYENEDQTRYIILWEEDKGGKYLHVVYPWHDFMDQPGLFNTIEKVLVHAQQHDSETLIWWDLTEKDVSYLPLEHPFDLPSPWILHGSSKKALLSDDLSASFDLANQLIQNVEEELKDLEKLLEKEADTLDILANQLEKNDDSIQE